MTLCKKGSLLLFLTTTWFRLYFFDILPKYSYGNFNYIRMFRGVIITMFDLFCWEEEEEEKKEDEEGEWPLQYNPGLPLSLHTEYALS